MPNVLLVEDSATQSRLVISALKKTACQVTCVASLGEAMEEARGGAFDAVILDLHLPDSEGLDTYLRMQEAAGRIPIVVLTSTDDEELAMRMLRSGAQDYLVKGEVTNDWIVRSIRYSIERHGALPGRGSDSERGGPDGSELFESEQLGEVTVLRVREKLLFGDDLADRLTSQLLRIVDEENKRKIILDFQRVKYISNSLLTQLLALDEKIRQHEGNLRICNLRREVQDQIKARRLLAQFDICIDEQTALRGL